MIEVITLERGWLKKQLDKAEQEILTWPEWKRVDIDNQYRELRKHIAEGVVGA
ncbi:MAG: hypothetical protein ACYC1K_03455 [Minisyncoccota bacterium]